MGFKVRPQLIYPRKRLSFLIVEQVGWESAPVWRDFEKRKSPAASRFLSADRSTSTDRLY